MTDLRTHWMRTVHEALCGLSAKRLPRGERIIGGECATADVTCLGCRAVLRLAAMDEATSDTDLRTLAQAVVDALSGDDDYAIEETLVSLETALGSPAGAPVSTIAARAILAALDAADAQGYARAMGEVVERCEATVTDNAKGRRWDPYTMGLCDEMDRVADWARERLPAAAEKEHGG